MIILHIRKLSQVVIAVILASALTTTKLLRRIFVSTVYDKLQCCANLKKEKLPKKQNINKVILEQEKSLSTVANTDSQDHIRKIVDQAINTRIMDQKILSFIDKSLINNNAYLSAIEGNTCKAKNFIEFQNICIALYKAGLITNEKMKTCKNLFKENINNIKLLLNKQNTLPATLSYDTIQASTTRDIKSVANTMAQVMTQHTEQVFNKIPNLSDKNTLFDNLSSHINVDKIDCKSKNTNSLLRKTIVVNHAFAIVQEEYSLIKQTILNDIIDIYKNTDKSCMSYLLSSIENIIKSERIGVEENNAFKLNISLPAKICLHCIRNILLCKLL